MKPRRLSIAGVVALVAAFGGLSIPVSAEPAGNAVADWNLIAINTLIAFPLPAGGAPPASQVHVAMTQFLMREMRASYSLIRKSGPSTSC